MARFDGSLARTLDFGDRATDLSGRGAASLRLAAAGRSGGTGRLLRGPDKYKVLDRRRRAAQIRARHALDLIEVMESAGEGK